MITFDCRTIPRWLGRRCFPSVWSLEGCRFVRATGAGTPISNDERSCSRCRPAAPTRRCSPSTCRSKPQKCVTFGFKQPGSFISSHPELRTVFPMTRLIFTATNLRPCANWKQVNCMVNGFIAIVGGRGFLLFVESFVVVLESILFLSQYQKVARLNRSLQSRYHGLFARGNGGFFCHHNGNSGCHDQSLHIRPSRSRNVFC